MYQTVRQARMSIGDELSNAERALVPYDAYRMEPKRPLPCRSMLATVPKLEDMRRIIQEKKKELGYTGIFKPKEEGVTTHNFPATIMDDIEASDNLAVDEKDTNYDEEPLLLTELSDLYHTELGTRSTKGGAVIPLVVLSREMRGNHEWVVPERQLFLDLVVHLHSVTVRDAALNKTLEWNNFWEGIGLLGINTRNRGLVR